LFRQNKELVGDNGLLPLKSFLSKLNERFDKNQRGFVDKFQQYPTLLWLLEPWNKVDWALDALALTGIGISSLIFITGAANSVALLSIWIFYHSIVQVQIL
jgi:hypothetical protein